MAKVEFNVAWWKKHSAKTLTDTGMSDALRKWEGAKDSEGAALVTALTALHKAAVEAEKKANKTLHKETIGFLQTYQKMCAEFIAKLKKADGSSLATADKVLTKPVLEMIGADQKGKMFVAELMYLAVTKRNPKEASEAVYKTFISSKAPRMVNISGPERSRCDDLAKAGTWVDDGWKEARDEVEGVSLAPVALKVLREQVLGPMEAAPVLKEIRNA